MLPSIHRRSIERTLKMGSKKDEIQKSKLKDRFTKQNVLSSLTVCLALSLTVGLFSPFEIFLSSQSDFLIGYQTFLVAMIPFSLAMFVVLELFLLAMLIINENIFRTLRDFLLGLLLTMYIQMLFFNRRMGLIAGYEVEYQEPTPFNILNLLFFFISLFIPVFIWRAKIDYPKINFLKKFNDKMISAISLVLIVMQLTGSVGMVLSGGLDEIDSKSQLKIQSYESAMKLSKDGNVVVFLTDKLDGIWMDDVIDKYPEVNDMFEGFIYYRNNISKYTGTFPSVPEMLTNYEFKYQPIGDYLEQAWENENLLKTLKNNGYRVNLLADAPSTFKYIDYVKDYIDTYDELDSGYKFNYIGHGGIVPTMIEMSLIKLCPYFIKAVVSYEFSSWNSDMFFVFDESNPTRMKGKVSPESDLDFYNYLRNFGLNTQGGEKTFSFIHLNASHDDSEKIAALYSGFDVENSSADVIETTRGCVEILNEYFAQMKELGIYDSSTIIILGDHGRQVGTGENVDDSITTTLLIKEVNSKNEPLKIDSEIPLSNEYFYSSILEYCGLDHSDSGVSYNDVIGGNIPDERIMTVQRYRTSRASPSLVNYFRIVGDARDFNNWEYIEPN